DLVTGVQTCALPISKAVLQISDGLQAMSNGDVAGAVREFRFAAQTAPDLAEAHNLLGMALAKQGDTALAQAEFRTAIELEPENEIGRASCRERIEHR